MTAPRWAEDSRPEKIFDAVEGRTENQRQRILMPSLRSRKPSRFRLALAALSLAGPLSAQTRAPADTYWVYVGAESADLIHRIRFGPGGAVVEKTITAGESATEMEGPHGLQISRDGKFLHMT